MKRISYSLAALVSTASFVAADPLPSGQLSPDESAAMISSYNDDLVGLAQLRAHDAVLLSWANAKIDVLEKELAQEQAKSANLAKTLGEATKRANPPAP